MIKDPRKKYEVEFSTQNLFIHLVDTHVVIGDMGAEQIPSYLEATAVDRIDVNGNDFCGTAALTLERKESVIGADVEDSQTVEPVRQLQYSQQMLLVLHRHGSWSDDPVAHVK